MNKLYRGDAITVLRRLPDCSVQCCITSPPYWGLRDYGTAKWQGGDAECEHKVRLKVSPSGLNVNPRSGSHQQEGFRQQCPRCGARRIDQQLGLEPTPSEYVARMVEVFREVRRVLRPDGTLWLNLGSSYASGDMNPSQSPLVQRELACGNDDTEPQGSITTDSVCCRRDDECRVEPGSRHGHISRNGQSRRVTSSRPCTKAHGNGNQDFAGELAHVFPPGVQQSTNHVSCGLLSGVSCLSTKASASRKVSQTTSRDALPSEHRTACTSGIAVTSQPLVVHKSGKESFFSACHRPDCKGVGKCGLCWCSLAIPSLNIKAKDEVNLPHLVAMALQADGWVLRQTIIWHKPNPMPESVRDRPTKSHEYIFLLTKSARYFWDQEAVREPATPAIRVTGPGNGSFAQAIANGRKPSGNGKLGSIMQTGDSRNIRTVWTIPPRAFRGAHFATFPPALVERCVKAGTSERGACPRCGKAWERVTERGELVFGDGHTRTNKRQREDSANLDAWSRPNGLGASQVPGAFYAKSTLGFRQSCTCPAAPAVPCVVLDPFIGSGTVAAVARSLGRDCIGIDLNPKYLTMARARIKAGEAKVAV